ESVMAVMKRFPKLGHLLGKLCMCQYLITHDPLICSQLLRCVQLFRVDGPQGKIESKAKEWAESQIRLTLGLHKQQQHPSSPVAEAVSYTPLEFNKLSTDMLVSSIERDLEFLVKQQQQCLLGLQPQGASLHKLCGLCLPLLTTPSSKRLVESLLRLHPQSQADGLTDLFLERVTQTQASAYGKDCTGEWNLAYESMVSLWLKYLPAVEQEIFLLLRAAVCCDPQLGRQDALALINSRGLARACAENRVLYQTVDSCIQQVLWQTDGSQHVMTFLHMFQVAVNEAINNSSQASIHRLFPQRLLPLVNLLAVEPADLPPEAHPIHLSSISCILAATVSEPIVANNPQELYAVWMLLVKFCQWYHAALCTLVRMCGGERDGETLEACLHLMTWFHHPLTGASLVGFREQVLELAKTINRCMMGDTVKMDELKMAVSQCYSSNCLGATTKPIAEFCVNLLMAATLQITSLTPENLLDLLDSIFPALSVPSHTTSKAMLLLSALDAYRAVLMVSEEGFGGLSTVTVCQTVKALLNMVDCDVEERVKRSILSELTR
ncbi:Fanconi anemia group C protein homolog, partial [Diadema antillarum]|uniref:Fanconi anemia group C protein homolog n=1 Tax=Diadema antillarum TaxID=105358 RepID=UPI003A8C8536